MQKRTRRELRISPSPKVYIYGESYIRQLALFQVPEPINGVNLGIFSRLRGFHIFLHISLLFIYISFILLHFTYLHISSLRTSTGGEARDFSKFQYFPPISSYFSHNSSYFLHICRSRNFYMFFMPR